MSGDHGANASPGAPLPANLTLPGGAGCSATALYQVAAAPGQIVLTVGPGLQYQTIAAAVSAAANGDLILVQPGTYTDDFSDISKQVTIAGAGGLVTMLATEAPTNEKGFFVVDNAVQIDNFVFQGAAIPVSEGANAAGIRYQGGAMVLHNDAFIGNQNGILAAAVDNLPVNTIAIQGCTFDNNGNASGPEAGYTHNCYISAGVTALTATGSIFERANAGHELKSRAATNLITGNIFYDGPNGTASYSIDLPDGGADTVSGNIIEKGPHAENHAIIHFGGEGIPYAGSALTITGNRIINDLGSAAIGLLNQTTLQASMTGNELDYFEHATIGQGAFAESGNIDELGRAIAASSSGTFAPGTNLDDFSHDANAHTVTLTASTGVLGGGGRLTVFADAGHVTVVGGAGGLNYQEAPGFGGSQIMTAAGAQDTVTALAQDQIASNGQDSITLGSGNVTAQINGTASVAAGSGNSSFLVNGQTTITGAGGGDTVQVNAPGASASMTGAMAYLQVTVNGGVAAYNVVQGGALEQATIGGGAAQMRLYNATTNVTTAGAGGGCAITFGAGTALALCEGADTVHAGSGMETVIVCASSQVYAGSGSLAVFGRSESGQASVYGAGGTLTLNGDTGDITYFGGTAANTVNSLLSHCTMQGGAGLMSVSGGGDGEVVIGGSGGLVFATAGGADVISTQAGAHDTLSFAGCCRVVSNGTDVIAAGSGNSNVTANGQATITGSTGNASYVLNGADSLNGFGGTSATVGAGASDTVNGFGSLTRVSVSAGGTLTFSAPNAAVPQAATVTGGGTSLEANAGAAWASVLLTTPGGSATLGAGNFSVTGKAAGLNIQAGSGQDSVSLSTGGDAVQAGSGALSITMNNWVDQAVTTIHGGAGLLNLHGYGNILFLAGSGAANLSGTYGAETVTAGAGNITLQGGSSGTNFTAGSGGATVALTSAGGTVTLGSGVTSVTECTWGKPDIYVFNSASGGGTDTITGFRTATDSLVLNGVSVAGSSSSAGSTHLLLSDGTQVTLVGVPAYGVQPHHS